MKKLTREEVAAKWLMWASGYYGEEQFTEYKANTLAVKMLRELDAAKGCKYEKSRRN